MKFSIVRRFFEVLDRAIFCSKCQYCSPFLNDHKLFVQHHAGIGELVEKIQPGELLERTDEQFEFKKILAGKLQTIGSGSTASAAMTDAYEVLRR